MRTIARWRWWLGSVLMGRRPRWSGYSLTAKGRGPMRPFVRQPWMGPPEDELGVGVPVNGVLTEGAEVLLGLTWCVAFTTGFQLGVGILKKREPPPIADPRRHREMPEMSLQIGVRFADGRESDSAGGERQIHAAAVAAGEDPPVPVGPMIGSSSGGGGGRRWDWTFWVWPLPPDGPMTVTCHWPAGGVPDGQVEVDGTTIRVAGAGSKKLWAGD